MKNIYVSAGKGGLGRTTIAANVGYCLSKNGARVLLKESDYARSLGMHFYSMSEDIARLTQMEWADSKVVRVSDQLDLSICAQFKELGSGTIVPFSNEQQSELHRKQYDYQIHDTRTDDYNWIMQLGDGDVIVVCVGADPCSFQALPTLLNEIQRNSVSVSDLQTIFLLNKYEPELVMSDDVLALYLDQLNLPIGENCLLRDSAVIEAFGKGMPVSMYSPNSKASMMFEKITNSIMSLTAVDTEVA